MAFPPNLFLIGAQKAGTTFLANLIDQHPDICVSEPKEPAYLTRNRQRGLDWYRSRFKNPDAAYLVDATTGYTSSPLLSMDEDPEASGFWGVPERMQALSPQAALVYVVRDPVSRTYSAYWHNVRAGHESRPFREALEADSYYLRTSCYYDQLELYRRYFSREQILVLKFEDLVGDPSGTVARCFSFLSLDAPSSINVDQGKNRSFTYPAGLSHINKALSTVGGLGRVTKLLRPVMPSRLKSWLFGSVAKRVPPISPVDRQFLAKFFVERNTRLGEEYGIDVSNWLKPTRESGHA